MSSAELIQYENRKKDFALAWLRNQSEPLVAAREIVGQNSVLALSILQNWTCDPVVLQYRKELLEEYGEESFLPSKADMVKKLLKEIESNHDPDIRLKYYKLCADIQGFLQKDSININTTVGNQTNVMLVPTSRSDDDWEKALAAQQSQLLVECEAIDAITHT